jgi:hypothetical protein
MNGPRASRWLALTGPLATVIFAVVVFGLETSTPGEKASAKKVMDYYDAHQGRTTFAALLAPAAGAALVVFACYLRSRVRDSGHTGVGPTVFVSGTILWASGIFLGSTIDLVLVGAAHHNQAQVAETANVFSNDTWIPFIAGVAIMLIGAGWTVLSTGVLPKWLGWIALVVGLISLVGPGGFLGFFVGPLWLLVAGIMLFLQTKAETPTPASAAVA